MVERFPFPPESMNSGSSRRDFLRAASAAALFSPTLSHAGTDKLGRILPQRELGATGVKVTAFGLGGHHVGMAREEKLAQALIERAIEKGVRLFDNAANYNGGLSEEFYGRFLSPKFRDQVFITTKSTGSTKESVRKDLETSRRRMKLDQLDLWQMHSLKSVDDVKNRIANGVVDEFLAAKAKGKTRFIGFTGHTSQEAHCYFIDWCAERGLQMDTCLMPVNLFDNHYDSFLIHVEPKLRLHKIGLLAMKSMVFGRVFGKAKELDLSIITPANLHGYVYSLPVCCLLSGCETPEQIDQNTTILEKFLPMDDKRRRELVDAVKPISGPDLEYYKRKI